MRTLTKMVCGISLLGASMAVAAGFDGSTPLLCAVTDTVSCDRQGHCVEGPANAVNLPTFIRLDAKNKTAESSREGGETRTSRIFSVHAEKGALVLLGVEQGGGWSAVIGEQTGNLTLTVAEEGIAYIVFGACLRQ